MSILTDGPSQPAAAIAVAAWLTLHGSATAQQTVVVTATRTETPAFEVPASIDSLDGSRIRADRLQVNLSESLAAVAGLQARDRQNFAQDVQVSVRGFGARSSFGIRGVRLYVDGIPATLPDGQGQLSNIELGSVERFEVLRGPFSALYGNSSGGVLQAFTEDGRGPPTLTPGFAAGSDGAARAGLKLTGSEGAFGYTASTSHFETDGYRRHSAARRQLANAKLHWQPDGSTRWTLIANHVALPFAQDPLGLTRAQFEADPRGVDPAAETFDTRKTVSQTQLGLRGEQRFGGFGRLTLMVYGGQRETEQFQAIPVATQNNPLHPGGVIQLERSYRGADLRWTTTLGSAERPLSLVAGIAHDQLDEHRSGRQNFTGSTLGVAGALRRDEDNRASNLDPYVQLAWRATEALNLHAGLRHSRIRFRSEDRYIAGTNPDDSGSVSFEATLPVLGLNWAVAPAWRLYATAGRGFETPTLNELAYRPGGATGMNLALRPARSSNAELGVKARLGAWGEGSLAAFAVRTRDEIVTLTNAGGRSTFSNAGTTRRTGWEASWVAVLAEVLELRAAWTQVDARYRTAFTTCAGAPCTTPTLVIPAGNRLPGVARSGASLSAQWAAPQGWRAGVELRGSSRVFVNDANSDAAAGAATVNLSLGYTLKLGGAELSAFARVDNVAGETYAGSVIVNEGNSRFFEPAPGRTGLVGLSAVLRF